MTKLTAEIIRDELTNEVQYHLPEYTAIKQAFIQHANDLLHAQRQEIEELCERFGLANEFATSLQVGVAPNKTLEETISIKFDVYFKYNK